MHAHPPFDPELAVALEEMRAAGPSSITPESIGSLRQAQAGRPEQYLGTGGVAHEEYVLPEAGGWALTLSVFRKSAHSGGPGIYYIHGGGMVAGNRFTGLAPVMEWVEQFDAVVVSVEYRLAPEHPYPAPLDDCYRGLLWTIEHAGELGYDPGRLLLAGTSAGGGLAAGVALRHRDEGLTALAGQVLICPMLDDRNETVSSRQIDGVGLWDRGSNSAGWSAYLRALPDPATVPAYAAPARAGDFAGLPPTFLDVGSAEVFRDEVVAYACALWAAGGAAELHVWPGGFHGFDKFVPDAALSRVARETRSRWFQRTILA